MLAEQALGRPAALGRTWWQVQPLLLSNLGARGCPSESGPTSVPALCLLTLASVPRCQYLAPGPSASFNSLFSVPVVGLSFHSSSPCTLTLHLFTVWSFLVNASVPRQPVRS